MRRLEWKVQAENDLFDILDYIGQDNADAAVKLVQKICTKVEGLRERQHCIWPDARGTREMIVHRHYVVFYRANDESDEVVTVLRVKQSTRQQWP